MKTTKLEPSLEKSAKALIAKRMSAHKADSRYSRAGGLQRRLAEMACAFRESDNSLWIYYNGLQADNKG